MNIDTESSTPIKVLILSDRLIDYALKLADYLTSVGLHVIDLTTTKEEALRYCNEHIDFLIIAGYLKDTNNYGVIHELNNRKLPVVPVIWAILDALIISHCNLYRIPLRFERTLPMSDFVTFLKEQCPK